MYDIDDVGVFLGLDVGKSAHHGHGLTPAGKKVFDKQLRLHPSVKAEVDEGYRGLAGEFPGQVTAPPKKPKADAPDGEKRARREMRRRQSSRRIVVEHANAEMRQWRPLHRTPRDLRRNPPHHRGPGLRPRRPAPHPARTQHRTGARPPGCLLITHQPNRQASTPQPQSPTDS
ncbi:hypothetical protein AB0O86_34695 [Streptomyces hirsutus]